MTPFEVLVQGWEQTWVEPSLALETWFGLANMAWDSGTWTRSKVWFWGGKGQHTVQTVRVLSLTVVTPSHLEAGRPMLAALQP